MSRSLRRSSYSYRDEIEVDFDAVDDDDGFGAVDDDFAIEARSSCIRHPTLTLRRTLARKWLERWPTLSTDGPSQRRLLS